MTVPILFIELMVKLTLNVHLLFNKELLMVTTVDLLIIKFYRGYFDLMPKFNVEVKSFLSQGHFEPELYGD